MLRVIRANTSHPRVLDPMPSCRVMSGGSHQVRTDRRTIGTAATVPTTSCEYFFELEGNKFVDAAPGGTGTICGNRITFKA